jgi:ABC-type dipeptide/oligopeptide/nickel transport system permease subunit
MPDNTPALPAAPVANDEILLSPPGAWQKLRRDPRAMSALAVILFMAALALSAGYVAPYSYREQFRGMEGSAPAGTHLFGTDTLGRDIFTRVMHGAKVSLLISFCATTLSLFIGVLVGLASGYTGGMVDAFLMRVTDTFAAFPSLLLAVAITSIVEHKGGSGASWMIFDPSVQILFCALGIVGWTGIARVVRSQVLSVKTLDYVTAARALGAGNTRIMLRHVLPNCLSPIIVIASLAIGGNILGEAGLSFLGLGVQDPFPSWGSMLSDARSHFRDFWWMAVFPGLAIVFTVLAFNMFGDSLRDALDPRGGKR